MPPSFTVAVTVRLKLVEPLETTMLEGCDVIVGATTARTGAIPSIVKKANNNIDVTKLLNLT